MALYTENVSDTIHTGNMAKELVPTGDCILLWSARVVGRVNGERR